MMQFSLISLIPGLLRNLQDCAGPELNNYERKLTKPTSLRTSDRNSLLSYMGLPLQIFGKVRKIAARLFLHSGLFDTPRTNIIFCGSCGSDGVSRGACLGLTLRYSS